MPLFTRSKRLSCETSDKKVYNCNSTVESAWVRIWDTTFYKTVIDNCGMKWHEQYQDVMYMMYIALMYRKVPCVIGSLDYMLYVKKEVNKTSSLTVTIRTCNTVN